MYINGHKRSLHLSKISFLLNSSFCYDYPFLSAHNRDHFISREINQKRKNISLSTTKRISFVPKRVFTLVIFDLS